MLQIYLSDQQFNCQLRYDLYESFDSSILQAQSFLLFIAWSVFSAMLEGTKH